ncbi:sporulation membrane protein YtaF [Ornithinibacillus gellani]|nr:sporulation membrane protein YtaF [Ornithinibacillus gellani]
MLFYMGLIFLIIAVSLDSFGVGIAYGMQKIHVPWLAMGIIMCCSGVIVFLSMTVGHVLNTFISASFTKWIGGFILIAIGLFSFVNSLRSQRKTNSKEQSHSSGMQHFKTVLTAPDQADLDHSGIITAGEALLLGAALALDAFGAGIGAAIIGYPPLITAFSVACMSGIFLHMGMCTGFFLSQHKKMQRLTFLPSVLLITLGIMNIIA